MTTLEYVVNSPHVVGEIIDDEAIILNLDSGQYFSTEASGAIIWSAVESGVTVEETANRLVDRFEIAPERAVEEAANFLKLLEEHGLVRAEPAPAGLARLAVPGSRCEAFAAPQLGIHSDLDDLLRLDPIHDVDQMGWPISNPNARDATPTATR